MSKATDTQWRVQTKATTGRWINRGLYETRDAARAQAHYLRTGRVRNGEVLWDTALGFGNTRVVRFVKPQKVRK